MLRCPLRNKLFCCLQYLGARFIGERSNVLRSKLVRKGVRHDSHVHTGQKRRVGSHPLVYQLFEKRKRHIPPRRHQPPPTRLMGASVGPGGDRDGISPHRQTALAPAPREPPRGAAAKAVASAAAAISADTASGAAAAATSDSATVAAASRGGWAITAGGLQLRWWRSALACRHSSH